MMNMVRVIMQAAPNCTLVSFPDPALEEGEGLVYIEPFMGLDDVAFLNSVVPIRFMPCGLHVIIM